MAIISLLSDIEDQKNILPTVEQCKKQLWICTLLNTLTIGGLQV